MNILLLGSGGREHALAWKIAQSPKCDRLFIAPGNGGSQNCGTNVPIKADEFEQIGKFAIENLIGMVVVGPEAPLVKGIADYFQSQEPLKAIPVIGPSKKAAQLEGSKAFSKQFMQRHAIPTAAYREFNKDNVQEGKQFIDEQQPPIVLKADGLAAGKGVIIAQSKDEAKDTLEDMILESKFGEASSKVVIEQFLEGIEFSVFILTDGRSYKILPTAKDYKRIGEGDTGLNTGGMGAVSPVPFADEGLREKVESRIIRPTIEGLIAENISYKGFLYFGLMNMDGDPYVIEYNVRMGDPETQVVIPRIKTDLMDLFEGVANNALDEVQISIDPRTCATVVLASEGYPKSYEKGKEISGANEAEDSLVFHAGTKIENGQLLTNGGRVLAVSSFGENMEQALQTSYNSIEQINFDGKYYRKDIGYDLVRYFAV